MISTIKNLVTNQTVPANVVRASNGDYILFII